MTTILQQELALALEQPAGGWRCALGTGEVLMKSCWLRVFALTTVVCALVNEAPGAEIRFVDVTEASGLEFVHNTGAFGKKWLPETMGSGVVLFDYDGDGRLDILLVNGTRFAGQPGRRSTQALFRNVSDGELRFSDVTRSAGMDVEGYCMAGAAGDLDNDGDADVYLSCVGNDLLLRNDDGRFTDVSREAGLTEVYEFGASVALLDADNDGWLDIFASRYVTWTPATDLHCTLDGSSKSYCTPETYRGAAPRFYRNTGGLRFEDWTRRAGLFTPDAKALGVTVLDLDDDGWMDLAVANDTQPNQLFHNRGDGTFEEIGLTAGVGFDANGIARGGMGIDAADYDGSGRESIVIGNFDGEMVALYQNVGNQLFIDAAAVARIGRPTLTSLTFATFFFDYDLDGDLDLLVANGHLEPEIEAIKSTVRYAQPTQLFRNDGGRFTEVTDSVGGDLARPRVARGAASGDLDGDGDPDVVITSSGGPAQVFENTGAHGNWLRVRVTGSTINHDGLGTVVELVAGGALQRRLIATGGSYMSQSDTAALFGLGHSDRVNSVKVRSHTGEQSVLVAGVNQEIVVTVDGTVGTADQADAPPHPGSMN